MRSFAARHADTPTRRQPCTLLLVGQTDPGGDGAPLSVEQSARGVVDTITAHEGDSGLHHVNYQNRAVEW